MPIPIYQVDAFTDVLFRGNPAAVCPLDEWLDDATLQSIAAENNLSETAYLVRRGDAYALRWFTPTIEVDLCGHATLASAFVIFERLERGRDEVTFETRSGLLHVRRRGDALVLDLPARPASPIERADDVRRAIGAALGREPEDVLLARDCLAVYRSEADVAALVPDEWRVRDLPGTNLIATAPGCTCDFVSRFFAPKSGVLEDPVTGSAHATLAPYWSRRLGRRTLDARQISRRGGELRIEDRGDRVSLEGRAVMYLEGWIAVDRGGIAAPA